MSKFLNNFLKISVDKFEKKYDSMMLGILSVSILKNDFLPKNYFF